MEVLEPESLRKSLIDFAEQIVGIFIKTKRDGYLQDDHHLVILLCFFHPTNNISIAYITVSIPELFPLNSYPSLF